MVENPVIVLIVIAMVILPVIVTGMVGRGGLIMVGAGS